MNYYPTILTFHIVFAGLWLIYFTAEIILKSQIKKAANIELKNQAISLYLKFSNLFGIAGSIGIAITGVLLVWQNSGFGYFDMTNNHWLATKQILFVIILITTFSAIIPTSQEIKARMNADGNSNVDKLLSKFYKANMSINIIVLVNFIFAITHRFYS
ncbi:MAG: hypothetical protein GY936_09805 [Ignavibacteriae bacterium]|nr:hypothetical protein [Ignavibacteriota bacterium]